MQESSESPCSFASWYDQKPSLFQKALQYFRTLFAPPQEKGCPELSNHIHSLQQKAENVRRQLKGIKAELKDNGDHPHFLQEVINPMLRQVNDIKDEESIHRIKEWMEKGGHWIQLYSKNKGSKKITKAVTEYAIKKGLKNVDRDLELIETYAMQRLNEVEQHDAMLIKEKIFRGLKPLQNDLHALKTPPIHLPQDLVQLNNWKRELDDQRADLMKRTFQLIDILIERAQRKRLFLNEHARLIDK